MDLFAVIFYLVSLLVIASALVMVFSRNIVRSAFALMVTLLGIAVIYVLLYADFVAVTQLLVYVGGILILVLFGVMLTTQGFTPPMQAVSHNLLPSSLFAAVVAVLLATVYFISDWNIVTAENPGSAVSDLGSMLLTDYVLPFQVAAILLLVAIIGAILMASRERQRGQETRDKGQSG